MLVIIPSQKNAKTGIYTYLFNGFKDIFTFSSRYIDIYSYDCSYFLHFIIKVNSIKIDILFNSINNWTIHLLTSFHDIQYVKGKTVESRWRKATDLRSNRLKQRFDSRVATFHLMGLFCQSKKAPILLEEWLKETIPSVCMRSFLKSSLIVWKCMTVY